MLKLWLVWRYFAIGRKYLNLTTALSILGMALGVGSLVVSMVVVSSYLVTLKSTVIDSFGDVMVMHSRASNDNMDEMIKKIRKVDSSVKAHTPYVNVEAVFARAGKVSGVMVQGFDLSTMKDVLNMESHLYRGEFNFETKGAHPGIFIGKRLAEKYNIRIGDNINLVVPQIQTRGEEVWKPKLGVFTVKAVLFFGRYDYDTKYMVADINEVQKFGGIGKKISGFRIKLDDSDHAESFSEKVSETLGDSGYWSMNWKSLNYNLFSAIDYEKYIIFFVLLIIVIAACFTISSTLYVHVLRRFEDISILKTMGATPGFIWQIFSFQGLLLGFVGYLLGLLLGFVASYLFIYGVKNWGLLGAEVYKIDGLSLNIDFLDLFYIFVASLVICFISTLAPAGRGAKLLPAEGLKYE